MAQGQSQQVLYFSSALESESYPVFSKREKHFEVAKTKGKIEDIHHVDRNKITILRETLIAACGPMPHWGPQGLMMMIMMTHRRVPSPTGFLFYLRQHGKN